MGIFLVIGALAGLFSIWRQAKNRIYPETVVFDTFFISVLVGLIAARIAAIAINFHYFQFSFLSWLLPTAYPGMYLPAGILGSIGLIWYALRRKSEPSFWDFLRIMIRSFWITLGIVYTGMVFFGWEVGRLTAMPWGIVRDGYTGTRHPVALYKLVVLTVVFFLYVRVSRKRTYSSRSESIALLIVMVGILFFVDMFAEFRVYYWKLGVEQVGYLVIIVLCILQILPSVTKRLQQLHGHI